MHPTAKSIINLTMIRWSDNDPANPFLSVFYAFANSLAYFYSHKYVYLLYIVFKSKDELFRLFHMRTEAPSDHFPSSFVFLPWAHVTKHFNRLQKTRTPNAFKYNSLWKSKVHTCDSVKALLLTGESLSNSSVFRFRFDIPSVYFELQDFSVYI